MRKRDINNIVCICFFEYSCNMIYFYLRQHKVNVSSTMKEIRILIYLTYSEVFHSYVILSFLNKVLNKIEYISGISLCA